MYSHAFHDSRRLLAVVVLVGGCITARADECTEAQAKACLALAKAKRERVTKLTATADVCHTDIVTAKAEAVKTKKPLVLWVGVKCADKPALRKALGGCIHCHVATRPGSERPEIIIEGDDGVVWSIEERRLDEGDAEKIADKIKRAARIPAEEPRRGVVQEDLSRRPFGTGQGRPTIPTTSATGAGVSNWSSPGSMRMGGIGTNAFAGIRGGTDCGPGG